eukprot:c10864_g1_i1.p1 GENE.c10864_g1_i1~~c10864_g1_i1.p1  ORF type:complete len:441 (-),score=87.41 c10864_g1_i1:127-1380(-)
MEKTLVALLLALLPALTSAHDHGSAFTVDANAPIVPENVDSFSLLLFCWLLSPIAFKLNQSQLTDPSEFKMYLSGIVNLSAVLLCIIAMSLATVNDPIITVIMWLLTFCYVCTFPVSFSGHPWLSKLNTLGLTLAFVVLPFMALWLYSGLVLQPVMIFLGDGFGHLLPGGLNCLLAIQPLFSRDYLHLQKRETTLLIIGSIASYIMHMSGTGGSVLGNIVRQDSRNMAKNVQHSSDLLVIFASGVLGKTLARFELTSGLHILLPAICNFVTMSEHPQPSNMAKILHISFGISSLVAALMRFKNLIPEYMIVGILAAFNFTIGTPQIGAWASGWADPFGFLFLYYVTTLLYIAYVFSLFVSPQSISHWRLDPNTRSYYATPVAEAHKNKSVVEVEMELAHVDDDRELLAFGAGKSDKP